MARVEDIEIQIRSIVRDREREIVEAAYSDYIAYRRQESERHGASNPHCDDLVLHAPGKCVHCDKFDTLQQARKKLSIAFTGEKQYPWERPCPATLLRPVEKIERWYGNVPRQAEDLYDGPCTVA